MKFEGLTTISIAQHALRGHRQVEAPGFVVPDFMAASQAPETARHRFLDTGAAALRGILAGWVVPGLEAVLEIEDVTEYELGQAREAFVAAAAAVTVEIAVHAAPLGSVLVDRSGWRRVRPGDFPQQAHDLVPEAQVALTRYAVLWLVYVGTGTGASFLPRRAA